MQGPLWHPSPQCAVVLPQTLLVSEHSSMVERTTYIHTWSNKVLEASCRTPCFHSRTRTFRPWSLGRRFHLRSLLWGYRVQVLDLLMRQDWQR